MKKNNLHFTFNAISISLIWLPVIVLTLLNYYHFVEQHTLLSFARSLGLSHSRELTEGQFLLVFSKTFLTIGFIFPVLTFLFCYFFGLKIISRTVLFISLLLIFLNYINLLTIANTGSLMSWDFLVESTITAIKDPGLAREYVSFSSVIKVVLLLLLTFLIYLFTSYLISKELDKRKKIFISLIIIYLSILPILYFYSKLATKTKLDVGIDFVSQQVIFMLNLDEFSSSPYDELEIGKAIKLFQENVNAPDFLVNDQFKGSEKGSNLILIILETGPQLTVDYQLNNQFKNLQSLSRKSFITKNHYTTYPYTSDALFSMFTSLYPNDLRRFLLTEASLKSDSNLNSGKIGLFNVLSNSDYFVKIYMPGVSLFTNDEIMFPLLGADEVFIPSDDLKSESKWLAHVNQATADFPGYELINREDKAYFEGKLTNDLVILDKLLSDIKQNGKDGVQFASVFLPVVGHGPWPDLSPKKTLLETGKDIFIIQDKWIGKIIQTLKESGLANNTVIAITADHGLRTIAEYPLLKPGTLNEISFNVPLLIFAPNTLSDSINIPHATSHIDVMPSILSLLGIDSSSILMLGSPIWDSGLANRRTYLLANDYFGVDGYLENKKFFSFHKLSATETVSKRLYSENHKSKLNNQNLDSDLGIKLNITDQKSFQRAIKKHLLSTRRLPKN